MFRGMIDGIFLVEGTKDKLIWALSSSGTFSSRSFKSLISRVGPVTERWKNLWGMSVLCGYFCEIELQLGTGCIG